MAPGSPHARDPRPHTVAPTCCRTAPRPCKLRGWKTRGCRQDPFSYPHTPSFLLPLFSTFSGLSIMSVSSIPLMMGLLSSSAGSAAAPSVGYAGLDRTGSLGSTGSPCSFNRGQVRLHSKATHFTLPQKNEHSQHKTHRISLRHFTFRGNRMLWKYLHSICCYTQKSWARFPP